MHFVDFRKKSVKIGKKVPDVIRKTPGVDIEDLSRVSKSIQSKQQTRI